MNDRLARAIVRLRVPLMAVILAAAVFGAAMIGRTNINFDLTRYLSDDTMTKRALAVMREEFGSSEQLRVMFHDLDEAALATAVDELRALPEVRIAAHDPETGVKAKGGVTYQLVTLTLNDTDAAALVTKLRGMFPHAGGFAVGGGAASQLDVQRAVAREIPLVMLIAVVIVLIMLLVTSEAWLEPLIILLTLALSILINMGTNFILPDVSFITFAVSAILQLALSIDYAIMLLRAFSDRCEKNAPEEAMTGALSECFMRIASSALTTVAGLLSLLFMSFTIGFDIGVVLSKGIVISMLCVFLFMPGLTLIGQKPLLRTRHRPLRLPAAPLAKGLYRARRPVALVMAALVGLGAYLSSRNAYAFTAPDAVGDTESARVINVFGASDPLVFLVPGGTDDEDYDRQRALANALFELTRADGSPAVKDITAMVTTGEMALGYLSAADVAEMTGLNPLAVTLYFAAQGYGERVRADVLLEGAGTLGEGNETIASLREALHTARETFEGENYARMIVQLNAHPGDGDFDSVMDGALEAAKGVYADAYYVTGTPMSGYDIARAFHGDLVKVNIITLMAILLIVILSFRALLLPALIVLVIEGAIGITMGISHLMGQPIFFISYLITLSIQMGATIDYGILLSDQYRARRLDGLGPGDALEQALRHALPTILTSGLILVTAGYMIGKMCSIYYISSIGLLVSRGAGVSVALVLTLLPALLALCDGAVTKIAKAHVIY